MKIDSYAVNMASSSTSVKSTTVTEKAAVQINNVLPFNQMLANGNGNGNANSAALLMLSPEGQAQARAQAQARPNTETDTRTNGAENVSSPHLMDEGQMKLRLLEKLVETVTGKKYNFRRLDANMFGGQQIQQAMPMRQISFSLQRTETYYESHSMSFQASGVVNTADGRQISFDMNILSNYEFSSSSHTEIQARLKDPLVINFDGTLPGFTKDRYAFDLTIDGSPENIFMPTNGSGFLALDKDGNGKIDDGGELFGAKTGDGFGELAAYDKDGNGWIDENDGVFDELKIMFVDKDSGEFMLMSLKDAGVGAIFLGSTASNYEIKADGNETVGVARKHGVFLNENGSVGSIHHIDLTY